MSISNMRLVCIIVLSTLLSACNTLSVNDDPSVQASSDPLQNINRKIYSFNSGVDKAILRPIASGYDKVVPVPAKNGVSNFLSNFREPVNVFNNLLQGKFDRALGSTYRFVVNSTFGIVGLFDVAGKYQVHESKEDFGQTLASWGVKPGPYIMLPFLGPSNLRDGVGLLTDNILIYPNSRVTETSAQSTSLTVMRLIDTRVALLGADEFLEQQLDPYGFLKIAYEENRLNAIYDGQAPEIEEDFDF
ncbi:MAG: VacJ family lipoprotein [Acidiferrobacterales bacterium]|nr:VacJ family lipoprotein [Acidiferrobacterales bacterium]